MPPESVTTEICFICLNQFDIGRSTRKRKEDVGRGDSKLLERFLLLFNTNRWNSYGDGGGWKLFCDNCEGFVNKICDLYKELCEVEMKLNHRLGEVGELMLNAEKSMKGTALLAISKRKRSSNRKWYCRANIIEMRKALSTKCKSKIRRRECKVTIRRAERSFSWVGKSFQGCSAPDKGGNDCPPSNVGEIEQSWDNTEEVKEEVDEGEFLDNVVPGDAGIEMEEDLGPTPDGGDDAIDNISEEDEVDGDWMPPPNAQNSPIESVNTDHPSESESGDEGTNYTTDPITLNSVPEDEKTTSKSEGDSNKDDVKKLEEEIALKIETGNLHCDMCQLTFTLNGMFRLHMETHSPVPILKWWCKYCPLKFPTARHRSRHVRTTHRPPADPNKMENIQRNAEQKWPNQHCCGRIFKNAETYHAHLVQQHEKYESDDKRAGKKCYFCFRAYAIDSLKQFHLETHQHVHVRTEFRCDHLDCEQQQVFETVDKLTEHLSAEHPGQETVKCPDCLWPFLNNIKMELHKLVHLRHKPLKFKCPQCGQTSARLPGLEDHYNEAHLGNTFILKCPECGFLSRSKRRLFIHQKSVHKTMACHSVRCFTCEHCGMLFQENSKMKTHIMKRHKFFEKKWPCKVCQVDFLSPRDLDRHQKSKHRPPPSQNFICSECGKAFSKNFNLMLHMRTHDTNRFECHVCKKLYKDQGRLQLHIKNIHEVSKEDRKPEYICTECGRAYYTQPGLKSHMKQEHLPDDESNPLFRCSRCPRKFARRKDYNDHLTTRCWKGVNLEMEAGSASASK